MNASTPSTVLFDGGDLRLEQIDALAARRAVSVLDDGAPFRRRIDRGAAFLDTLLKEEGVIYGVTTGYGDSCTVAIPEALTEALPERIFTFHGCGLGDHFDEPATRAILAARLASLCRGYSGVR